MAANAYLTNDVQTTSPERLVQRLLEKAVRCIEEAGDPSGALDHDTRAARLRRAFDIVAELRGSLDLQAGGEIAGNLDSLYDFVSQRLLEASLSPGAGAAPLADAARILGILAEAWARIASGETAETEAANAGG